jgi:O-succinylbenzoic acid--CoA ligase
MEPPPADLTFLRARVADCGHWLDGPAASVFAEKLASARRRLEEAETIGLLATGPVVVAEEEPAAFLAAALASLAHGAPVALASPRWGERERTQAAALLRPGLWFGGAAARWPNMYPGNGYNSAGWAGAILIPTGGTGGNVRWAIHSWTTLAAAGCALVDFLAHGGPLAHVSFLPPWHVSGFLPAIRALVSSGATAGTLHLANWKTVEAGGPPAGASTGAVISLVPTQLQRLLPDAPVVEWLRGARAILLGGSAPLPGLLERARKLRLPVALAYGLTETAAAVAVQLPEDFLAGAPARVTALPHARLWVADDAGNPLPPATPGQVWVVAASVFWGSGPARPAAGPLATGDDGELDASGRLRLLGRRDRLIVTGGEKVDPVLVADAVREAGLVEDVFVVGVPHPEWGQQVVALYTGAKVSPAQLRAVLHGRIAAHAQPKIWRNVPRFPLDDRGKLDRVELKAILKDDE